MRWSRYFLHTTREIPSDAEIISHQLMVRSGMIRKLAAGIYTYLPFGWRSLQKLQAIVRRELNAKGALELTMPAVQPAELWKESERWGVYGKELLRMTDRHDREFCFGPTHEEVITSTVRHDIRSYKQLPVNLYQIQVKFRDEIRPRFGLMRGREFLMKDAYSFHATDESLDEAYQDMRDAYCRIFEACGLDYTVVEADSGAIGGSSSHEFMVVAMTGESAIVRCSSCDYSANTEKAETGKLPAAAADTVGDIEKIHTPGQTSVEDVAKFLEVPVTAMVKTLIYDSEKGELVAVAIRGDRAVNEIKLANLLGVDHLDLASEERVREATGAPTGFAGPVGLADGVRLLADETLRGVEAFATGANEVDQHYRHVQWGRDATPDEWVDVLLADKDDPCPRCDGSLDLFRGIEVGHIFKLGTKYSESMGCTFLDVEGKAHPMTMGCYGLGIGRTVAAAIEQNHDPDGIIWPRPLAPFEVLLIALNPQDEEVCAVSDRLYDELSGAGIDVLYDDRNERPGVKFKDADLVGIPVRVVVGKKGLAEGKLELSLRRDKERRMVAQADVMDTVASMLAEA